MTAHNMLELRKFVAPEFVYGTGALALAGRYAHNFGARKALVVTDPGVIQAGWTDLVCESLHAEDIESEVFQDVTINPKDHEVAEGCLAYAQTNCDIIIAVGGGSPMDCAKGIGITFANRCSVLDFEGVDEVPMPGPPLICIPTTAGTSADVSQFSIITDTARKVKIAIVSKTVVPDVALIDPETTTTMPADLTAATGIDALVHAIEAYVSNASSPITDLNALEAIRRISRNLKKAIDDPDNMEYRDNMMMASLFAGMAFSNASLGLVHAMAHSMGGLLNTPHGLCNALLLEQVVHFNHSAVPERYADITRAMGLPVDGLSPESQRDLLLKGLADLRESVGIPAGIHGLGVAATTIPQLAENAFHDACSVTNPRSATVKQIAELYEKAL